MKKLYLQAFPKSERKPFRLMRKKAREGVMELLVIHEKKELLGLAITVRYKDMVLLDYFAVETGHRGKKIGSCALELLKQQICEPYNMKSLVGYLHIRVILSVQSC